MNEVWKNIDPEGIYQVSSHGNVRRASTEHILKPWFNHKGYYKVRLRSWSPKNLFVHRLVAEAFVPNTRETPFVNHVNGIKTDNRAANLSWCTTEENNSHNDFLVVHKFIESLDIHKQYSHGDLLTILERKIF